MTHSMRYHLERIFPTKSFRVRCMVENYNVLATSPPWPRPSNSFLPPKTNSNAHTLTPDIMPPPSRNIQTLPRSQNPLNILCLFEQRKFRPRVIYLDLPLSPSPQRTFSGQ